MTGETILCKIRVNGSSDTKKKREDNHVRNSMKSILSCPHDTKAHKYFKILIGPATSAYAHLFCIACL